MYVCVSHLYTVSYLRLSSIVSKSFLAQIASILLYNKHVCTDSRIGLKLFCNLLLASAGLLETQPSYVCYEIKGALLQFAL